MKLARARDQRRRGDSPYLCERLRGGRGIYNVVSVLVRAGPWKDRLVTTPLGTMAVRGLLEAIWTSRFESGGFPALDLEWRDYVATDPALKRGGSDVANLPGGATAAHERLGWTPSVRFDELVGVMVDAEVERLPRGTFV